MRWNGGQLGLVRRHRPGAADLRRGLRGRAGHHGRRRARPAHQPRSAPARHAPLRPARAAVLRVLRPPDARPVQHQAAYYRCRYPREYALASHVRHPGNVYLREADLLPAIGSWLLVIFAPHRLEQTIREMQAAQDPGTGTAGLSPPAEDTAALIAGCDARLARYQAALDAGADPQAVAEWTRQVKAERAAALARDASQNRHTIVRQLTEDDIRALITGLGDLRDIIRDAEPPVKAAVYEQLGLQVTCLSGQGKLRAERDDQPGDIRRSNGEIWGNGSCPRGEYTKRPIRRTAPDQRIRA